MSKTPKAADAAATEAQPLIPSTSTPRRADSVTDPSVLVPGMVYVATSSSLILLNKHALASFNFHCPNSM